MLTGSRREEQRRRRRAGSGSAGRAGGITVVLALLAMFIVPLDAFRSMALGAVLAVIVAVLAALTFLPAILSVMGDRVNALTVSLPLRKAAAETTEGHGFWEWMTHAVMR